MGILRRIVWLLVLALCMPFALQAAEGDAPAETKEAPATPAASMTSHEAPVGLSFGYSPIYKPKVVSDVGSPIASSMDGGIRVGPYTYVGVQFAKGTIKAMEIPGNSMALNAVHSLWGIVVGGEIPLHEPLWGMFQVVIPLSFTTFMQFVTARDLYSNMGIDLGGGIGGRFTLSKSLWIDFGPWYHYGIPFWALRYTDDSDTLKTATGEKISGTTTGFVFRVALSVLFN